MATSANTVTGISKSGVSKIKSALDTYISEFKKACNVGAKPNVIQAAVKGTNAEAQVKQMATAINTKMENLVATLAQYKTQIDSVYSQYQAADANNTKFTNVTQGLNK